MLAVTVYEVIAEPLADAPLKVTTAFDEPATAETVVGAVGTPAGVTAADALEALPVPAAFVAVTVKVYAVPLARPVTVIGDAEPVPVKLPGVEVTVYEVMAEPPFEAGAVNATLACPLPAVAETAVGAPGTVYGVTELEAVEAPEVPTPLVAVTVKV